MTRHNQEGSTLVVVMMLMILLGGLAAAYQSVTWHQGRAARSSMATEFALRAAESGVAYFLSEYRADPSYFTLNPAPLCAQSMGDANFRLESATAFGIEWDAVIVGSSDGIEYPLAATFGPSLVIIPPRLQVTGDGSPGNVALDLQNSTIVGSYDSTIAAFDPGAPLDTTIQVDGSVILENTSTAYGDVEASGTLVSGSTSNVTGTFTASSTPSEVEDIDLLVVAQLDASKTANDNSNLSTIFGAAWTPIAGTENYGDLILSSGTYVVPPGTYRFRRLELSGSAVITFDTSSAPSTLVYVGEGAGTGSGNDLTLDQGSKIQIDAGGGSNGLLTVLGPDADLVMTNGSVLGQEVTDNGSGGYHQIVSLGGNGSSDKISLNQLSQAYGRLYAVAHEMTLNNSSAWFGSAIVKSATLSNAAQFAVDSDSLGGGLAVPGGELGVLATWRVPDSAP